VNYESTGQGGGQLTGRRQLLLAQPAHQPLSQHVRLHARSGRRRVCRVRLGHARRKKGGQQARARLRQRFCDADLSCDLGCEAGVPPAARGRPSREHQP
jgi:hypothetical protein